jgi:hypothetical protein
LVTEHEHRLDNCEHRIDGHDQDIAALIETVPGLPEPERRRVLGFTPQPKRQRRASPRPFLGRLMPRRRAPAAP